MKTAEIDLLKSTIQSLIYIFRVLLFILTLYTLTGTSSFVWLHIWVVFASPILMLRLRLQSEDQSSCSGPTRSGPSSVCPTFPCSAFTRSLQSRWPEYAALLMLQHFSARCIKTAGQQDTPLHQVMFTGALVTRWCRCCTYCPTAGIFFFQILSLSLTLFCLKSSIYATP